jgi:RHS repeat-associated protein
MNLAAGKVLTGDVSITNPSVVTDNDSWADSSSQYASAASTGLHYVKINLGAVYQVDKIIVWHYGPGGRTYHSTKTQVSQDGTTWYTVYDSAVSGEYPETPEGKTITFAPRNVQYIRDYVNGNTVNAWDHWTEIEVWGYGTVTYIGNYLEWTGGTTTMQKYYYAGNTRVAMRRGTSTLYWLFGDHLGSQAITTNSSGEKISEVRYSPWGEDRYYAYTSSTTYRFTGQRTEFGLGLMYYGARFYDPSLGRFISPDTLIPEQTQGVQAWDRYAYANNNPVKYTDPSGHCLILCTAIIGAGIGAIVGAVGYTAYTLATGREFNTTTMLLAAGGGAVAGALIGTGVGIAAGMSAAAATSATITGAGLATGATETLLTATGGDPTDEINAASQAFGDLSQAANYGVQEGNQLANTLSRTGFQVHHIIEQRLAQALGQSTAQAREWLSVAVTPQEHQVFTNAWRSAIGYSNQAMEWTTKNVNSSIIWEKAQGIYEDYPALLNAARNIIFGE